MIGPVRTSVEYLLLDRSGAPLGRLDGVHPGSGRLTRSAAASVKAKASLSLTDVGQVSDWTQVRVQPVVTVDGDRFPLGVFLPDVPSWSYDDAHREADVELLDKATILDGDSFGRSYGVPKGTNVTDAVAEVIESTGEPATGIEHTGDVLKGSIEWEPEDSKLAVVNDLLRARNFFSLNTSGNGGFRADAYVRPASRPVVAEFVDGVNAEAVYVPEFTREHDLGAVPNRVRVVSQGDGDEEGLFAEAVNTDPGSRFSFENLGYWRTKVETGVSTTSQDTLNAYAQRRLIESSEPQETVVIDHLPSRVTINDAVGFESSRHEIAGLWTVQKQEWALSFDGLVTSTLRRVVDL